MSKIVNIVITALLLTLLAVSSALATPPETVVTSWAVEQLVTTCEDFEIWAHTAIETRETTFFDKDGNALRFQVHGQGVDNLYNQFNPDYVIQGNFSWTYKEDLITGENHMSGLFWHVTIPGHGVALIDAGTGFIDWETGDYVGLKGHHELDDALCTALAVPEGIGGAARTSIQQYQTIFLPELMH